MLPFYVLLSLLVVIFIMTLVLVLKLYREVNEKKPPQTDPTLLLKSQETATTLTHLQQQFQILAREFQHFNEDHLHYSDVIDHMAHNINDLQKVMLNKKARGNWGEYQLEMLLTSYLGEHQNVLETQYPLANGTIVDAVIHLPNEHRLLALDAKFPLENYQRLLQNPDSRYESLFKSDIKKHIKDISRKYLTEQTLDIAVMFIPSEAIYSYICQKCPELLDESYRQHVLMTSPSTLAGVIFTLLNIIRSFKRQENIQEIEKKLIALEDDARRLDERMNKALQHANTTIKYLQETDISVQKIVKKVAALNGSSDEQ